MTELQNDITNEQAVSSTDPQENFVSENEINLIDYFLVLWKYKWLVLVGSVLPALIVGFALFFTPNRYEITYVYDVRGWDLNEKNYNIFISRFYSEENLNKIINKMREGELNEHAGLVSNAGSNPDGLWELLKFEPVPSYINLSKVRITNPDQLEQFRKVTAQLLNVTIVGRPKERLLKIASVVRDNIEEVMPIYPIQLEVINTINGYRAKMGNIEKNRFNVELALKRNKVVLAKLKEIEVGVLDKTEDNVVLQFNVGSQNEYLPLEYQIRATEANIIKLEANNRENAEKYSYYKNLLVLNEKLSAELEKSVSLYYTIQRYYAFLAKLTGDYEGKEFKDYLASYIKGIENRISISVPVLENPKMSSIAKGTVKKSAVVFSIALMLSVFAAFLSEGLKKSKALAS